MNTNRIITTKRTFFAPLWGNRYPFNSELFREFFETFPSDTMPKYPPTNIEFICRDDDNDSDNTSEEFEPYSVVTMAVAGFTKDDLTIKVDGSKVTISADVKKGEVLQEGLKSVSLVKQMAQRGFSNTIEFAAPIGVLNAACKDGVLSFEVHFLKPPKGELISIE